MLPPLREVYCSPRVAAIGRPVLGLLEGAEARYGSGEMNRIGLASLSGFGGSSCVLGTAEPVIEPRRAEPRVFARHKCALVYLCAEVLRVRVSEDLARNVACAEVSSDEFIETELFGPSHLNGTIHRTSGRNCAYRTCNIFGRHGLNKHGRYSNRVAVGRVVGDALDELEELRRANDRVGDRGFLDQLLLSELRAEVAAYAAALG